MLKTALGSLALIALIVAPAAADPKGDLAKIQGKWKALVGPNKDIPITVAIKDDAVTLSGTAPGGQDFEIKGKVKLDESTDPKQLTWTDFKGPDGSPIDENKAIYKLEGDDKLTVCSGGPGNDRPKEFKAGDGGPPNLTTFERVKDDK